MGALPAVSYPLSPHSQLPGWLQPPPQPLAMGSPGSMGCATPIPTPVAEREGSSEPVAAGRAQGLQIMSSWAVGSLQAVTW